MAKSRTLVNLGAGQNQVGDTLYKPQDSCGGEPSLNSPIISLKSVQVIHGQNGNHPKAPTPIDIQPRPRVRPTSTLVANILKHAICNSAWGLSCCKVLTHSLTQWSTQAITIALVLGSSTQRSGTYSGNRGCNYIESRGNKKWPIRSSDPKESSIAESCQGHEPLGMDLCPAA